MPVLKARRSFHPVRVFPIEHAPAYGVATATPPDGGALIDHADDMCAVLDEASDELASEYADLQQAAAAFTGHMNEVRDRWKEWVRANEPDGTTRGWRRDPMKGDLTLEADTGFRPRRAGSSAVLTTGRPGRTANAVAGFLHDEKNTA